MHLPVPSAEIRHRRRDSRGMSGLVWCTSVLTSGSRRECNHATSPRESSFWVSNPQDIRDSSGHSLNRQTRRQITGPEIVSSFLLRVILNLKGRNRICRDNDDPAVERPSEKGSILAQFYQLPVAAIGIVGPADEFAEVGAVLAQELDLR